jgi:hypothetical protein
MADKPQVHAWFLGEDIDPADPLAALKHRARAHDQAAEVLAGVGRAAEVTVRADAIGEVAAAFGEECFDPETVWDASTLSDADLDSAGHIAVTLAKIEGLGHA